MNQKRNKIIVLILFFLVISFIVFISLRTKMKIPPKVLKGEINGIVSGANYDAQFPEIIALPNINLLLIDKDDPTTTFQTSTNKDGSFTFSNIPSGKIYFIEVDNSQVPASYYFPYKGEISFPYSQKLITPYIKLLLNEAGLRDLYRQQSLYLYQSLLEDYKQDYGHYPVGKGDEQVLNSNSHLISLLKPYLTKVNMGVKNLLDPLQDRPFIYRSGGVHYWINAYPEVIIEIPLFDKNENSYLIYK